MSGEVDETPMSAELGRMLEAEADPKARALMFAVKTLREYAPEVKMRALADIVTTLPAYAIDARAGLIAITSVAEVPLASYLRLNSGKIISIRLAGYSIRSGEVYYLFLVSDAGLYVSGRIARIGEFITAGKFLRVWDPTSMMRETDPEKILLHACVPLQSARLFRMADFVASEPGYAMDKPADCVAIDTIGRVRFATHFLLSSGQVVRMSLKGWVNQGGNVVFCFEVPDAGYADIYVAGTIGTIERCLEKKRFLQDVTVLRRHFARQHVPREEERNIRNNMQDITACVLGDAPEGARSFYAPGQKLDAVNSAADIIASSELLFPNSMMVRILYIGSMEIEGESCLVFEVQQDGVQQFLVGTIDQVLDLMTKGQLLKNAVFGSFTDFGGVPKKRINRRSLYFPKKTKRPRKCTPSRRSKSTRRKYARSRRSKSAQSRRSKSTRRKSAQSRRSKSTRRR